VRICTLGDLLLDVIVRLGRPFELGADVGAETWVGPGGQAANVAAWAAALAAEARFVGKRGADAAGRVAADELAARGVTVLGPAPEGRTGVVVSIVGPDGERTMASDRGVSPQLSPDDLDESWLDGCDWLHVSGYALARSPISAAAAAAARAARLHGTRVSVDLAAWTVIREAGARPFRERVEALEPAVVFANEPEWEILGGAYALAETAVVKRGRRGVMVVGAGRSEDHEPLDATVLDTTGAGDALAAGFLVGGIELGLEAAARCVSKLGATA
jgi:sugar/nucleoside kinase (ribokinase family)